MFSDVDATSNDEAGRKRLPPLRLRMESESDSDSDLDRPRPKIQKSNSIGGAVSSQSFLDDVPTPPVSAALLQRESPATCAVPQTPRGNHSLASCCLCHLACPAASLRAPPKICAHLYPLVHSQRRLLKSLVARQQGAGTEDIPALPDAAKISKSLREILEIQRKKNSVVRYLATIWGDTAKEVVRRVLNHVLAQELVVQYTWQGTPHKAAFQALLLCSVLKKVVRATMGGTKSATDKEMDFAICEYFRTAADRNGGRKRRAERREVDAAV